MPARLSPHKPEGSHGTPEQRLRWTERAVAGRPGLLVSRLELDRQGPSYTVDTLEALAAAEPQAALWFVMGADQLLALPRWHQPERILAAARLGVVPRPGHDRDALADIADQVAPGRIDWVEMPEIAISSTMIRERIAAGLPIGHLVPQGVEGTLAEEGLVPSPPLTALRKEPSRNRSN